MTYFRRNAFHLAPNAQPKWHIFKERHDDGWVFAQCGYTYRFILEDALTKETVKTKKLVCAKCERGTK